MGDLMMWVRKEVRMGKEVVRYEARLGVPG